MSKPAWKVRVTFGAIEASALILNVQTTQSVDELSSAEVVLKLDASFAEPIDLFSEVKIIAVRENGTEEDLSITSGRPDARSSFASCGSTNPARHLSHAGPGQPARRQWLVEVHDPRAANDRDARLAITSAIGKWKTRFPQADAQVIDYNN